MLNFDKEITGHTLKNMAHSKEQNKLKETFPEEIQTSILPEKVIKTMI